MVSTPAWVKNTVFYQIFPDRFASSESVTKPRGLQPWGSIPTVHGFMGGDLIGVVEQLDYLQDLGVSGLYFTPIFQSACNHRYHTHDYFRIDPILGGDKAFDRLMAETKRRGMRVVLDGVFNHTSRGFFQFNHILETGQDSPYQDWFTIRDFPLNAYNGKPNYHAWWDLPALPKLNTDNPDVVAFLLEVARYWTEKGIDGWRLDVADEVDQNFWRAFRKEVKSINPEAYIVGEVWYEADPWLQGDQWDAIMNYPWRYACLGFFAGHRMRRDMLHHQAAKRTPVLDGKAFADLVEADLRRYHTNVTYSQLNMLGSHDTARFLSLSDGDTSSLKLATLFQMTWPGAPCIYYGDELGMEGGPDPDCRRAFTGAGDRELQQWVKACANLRQENPVLREGSVTRRHAEGSVYAFARQLGESSLTVVLNSSEEAWVLPDELRGKCLLGNVSGHTVAARSGVVLQS